MTDNQLAAGMQLQSEIKQIKEVIELPAADKALLIYSYGPAAYAIPQELKPIFTKVLKERLQQLQQEFNNL